MSESTKANGKRPITVILPTLNRENYLLVVLDDLLRQSYQDFDILIVDQSDQPSTQAQSLAHRYANRIYYHHVRFRGLPVARNYGWQNAISDIVIYLDDDVRCPSELVGEHAASMQDPTVGVVAGGIDEANKVEEKNPQRVGTFSFWTATPKRGFQSHTPGNVQHAPGGNFSVRRSLFDRVGGFDEAFSRGAALYEETDFCLRVLRDGSRIVFNPKARLTHLAATTGGCRVPNLGPYLRSLSRNRTAIIWRYLKWYQRPVAFVRLLLLNLSYVRSQREPAALIQSLRGLLEGFAIAGAPPLVTVYERGLT